MDRYALRAWQRLFTLKLTQHQIAKHLGVSQANVSAWSRQRHEIPTKYWKAINTLHSDLTNKSL